MIAIIFIGILHLNNTDTFSYLPLFCRCSLFFLKIPNCNKIHEDHCLINFCGIEISVLKMEVLITRLKVHLYITNSHAVKSINVSLLYFTVNILLHFLSF